MSAPGPIWMRLNSGLMLDLLDPSPHGWTDGDLAYRLSRTYRWSSDTRWNRPLSVAQHSLTVLQLRESGADRPLTAGQQLRELLHDATRACSTSMPCPQSRSCWGTVING